MILLVLLQVAFVAGVCVALDLPFYIGLPFSFMFGVGVGNILVGLRRRKS